MSNALVVEEIGRQTIIRFNRPEIRNPLSISMVERLIELVDRIGETGPAGVIFTGTGDVFASGADLREIADVTARDAAEFAMRGQTLMRKISSLTAPTIAAVNGICFGGALDLALSCDRRIASPGATFSHPGATLGIMTGWGGTQRLPRLIGEPRALELFFTARRIGADEALAIGLVDAISDDPVADALSSFD
jgi:enoyl-CoA hydratase